MSDDGYHSSRLTVDPRRKKLWRVLWSSYFNGLIEPDDCVLDLGCGHGDFINAVRCRRRVAVDSWLGCLDLLEEGVEGHVGDVTDLSFLGPGEVDFAFASNLFEHLDQDQFRKVLEQLREKLTARGSLTIIQPNYRYAFKEYFDDYTHRTVYSHTSLCDFLAANDYAVLEVKPRFLPLTIKSRLPVSSTLIRAYLASPFKPMGKQMLVRARPR